MQPTLKVACFPRESLLEKTTFSFPSGYPLEIAFGLGMAACVSTSHFSSRTPCGVDQALCMLWRTILSCPLHTGHDTQNECNAHNSLWRQQEQHETNRPPVWQQEPLPMWPQVRGWALKVRHPETDSCDLGSTHKGAALHGSPSRVTQPNRLLLGNCDVTRCGEGTAWAVSLSLAMSCEFTGTTSFHSHSQCGHVAFRKLCRQLQN